MKPKYQIDLWLLGPVAVLIIISLATLFSLNTAFFRSQTISLGAGLLAYLFFSKINIDFLKHFTLPIYIISLVFLAIILIIGIESHGAIRWIDILGVRLQFSEILKPFLALAFVNTLTKDEYISIKSFLKLIIYIIPIIILILMQPDLGSALLYGGVALFVLIVAGFPMLWFVLLGIPLIIVSPFLWYILHDYQRQRILTFLHSSKDPLGASYNGIQAIIAVGSGSFMGKGIAEGTQSVLRFLPERHTDFIFATIAEGIGFLGASLVVLALMFLAYRIYVIFRDSHDQFTRLFLATAFGFVFIQGFVNISMNMGLLPIVGITLPFVSFGGSSLMSNFIFLGIITSLSSSQKSKDVLEIK